MSTNLNNQSKKEPPQFTLGFEDSLSVKKQWETIKNYELENDFDNHLHVFYQEIKVDRYPQAISLLFELARRDNANMSNLALMVWRTILDPAVQGYLMEKDLYKTCIKKIERHTNHDDFLAKIKPKMALDVEDQLILIRAGGQEFITTPQLFPAIHQQAETTSKNKGCRRVNDLALLIEDNCKLTRYNPEKKNRLRKQINDMLPEIASYLEGVMTHHTIDQEQSLDIANIVGFLETNGARIPHATKEVVEVVVSTIKKLPKILGEQYYLGMAVLAKNGLNDIMNPIKVEKYSPKMYF